MGHMSLVGSSFVLVKAGCGAVLHQAMLRSTQPATAAWASCHRSPACVIGSFVPDDLRTAIIARVFVPEVVT
jgi:hypothetical protein